MLLFSWSTCYVSQLPPSKVFQSIARSSFSDFTKPEVCVSSWSLWQQAFMSRSSNDPRITFKKSLKIISEPHLRWLPCVRQKVPSQRCVLVPPAKLEVFFFVSTKVAEVLVPSLWDFNPKLEQSGFPLHMAAPTSSIHDDSLFMEKKSRQICRSSWTIPTFLGVTLIIIITMAIGILTIGTTSVCWASQDWHLGTSPEIKGPACFFLEASIGETHRFLKTYWSSFSSCFSFRFLPDLGQMCFFSTSGHSLKGVAKKGGMSFWNRSASSFRQPAGTCQPWFLRVPRRFLDQVLHRHHEAEGGTDRVFFCCFGLGWFGFGMGRFGSNIDTTNVRQ